MPLVAAYLMTILNLGCNGSSDAPLAPDACPSERIILATATVAKEGAEIVVTYEGSPFDGTIVRFPPDAVSVPDKVTLSSRKSTAEVRRGQSNGYELILEMQTSTSFEEGVTIVMTYDRGRGASTVIPYEVEEPTSLHVMQIKQLDKARGRLSVVTFKPIAILLVYP